MVNVIVVADVRGAAESVYLGATRSDEFFFLGRCGSSYQDSLPLAKLGLSTLSLLGSSGSNGISLPLLTEAVESFSALVFFLSVGTEQVSSIEARVKTRNSLGGVLKLLPSSEWPLRMGYSLNQIIDLLVFQIVVAVKVL